MNSTSRGVVLDTSGIVALIVGEPSASQIESRLRKGGPFYVAAPTLVELRLVLAGRLGRDADKEIDALKSRIDFAVLPFTETHANVAFEAWTRYGKGRHPAGLSLGDCMAYAAAKVARAELVYVGDDFSKTDLV